VLEALEYGMVGVNEGLISSEVPFQTYCHYCISSFCFCFNTCLGKSNKLCISSAHAVDLMYCVVLRCVEIWVTCKGQKFIHPLILLPAL
jgi:hypothetical protein